MLSEGGEENSIHHTFAAPFNGIIKRAGTERGTSSIIKSDQKDTEASIRRFVGTIGVSLIPRCYGNFLWQPE